MSGLRGLRGCVVSDQDKLGELADVLVRLDQYGVKLERVAEPGRHGWVRLSAVGGDAAFPGPHTLRRIAELLDEAAGLMMALDGEE